MPDASAQGGISLYVSASWQMKRIRDQRLAEPAWMMVVWFPSAV